MLEITLLVRPDTSELDRATFEWPMHPNMMVALANVEETCNMPNGAAESRLLGLKMWHLTLLRSEFRSLMKIIKS